VSAGLQGRNTHSSHTQQIVRLQCGQGTRPPAFTAGYPRRTEERRDGGVETAGGGDGLIVQEHHRGQESHGPEGMALRRSNQPLTGDGIVRGAVLRKRGRCAQPRRGCLTARVRVPGQTLGQRRGLHIIRRQTFLGRPRWGSSLPKSEPRAGPARARRMPAYGSAGAARCDGRGARGLLQAYRHPRRTPTKAPIRPLMKAGRISVMENTSHCGPRRGPCPKCFVANWGFLSIQETQNDMIPGQCCTQVSPLPSRIHVSRLMTSDTCH
jgi:hypothetical protein